MSDRRQIVAKSGGTSRTRNNLNTPNVRSNSRSVSDLSAHANTNSTPRDIRSVTLERNGSMPNLNVPGNCQTGEITRLRLEYDRYLSSLEAKYVCKKLEKNVISNINEQKKIFIEEFKTLYEQLSTLSGELEKINKLKIEKQNLGKKVELLKFLNENIVFNDSDKEILSLFTSTASKVIVKNFKEMNEGDFRAVNSLLNDIMEILKPIDHDDKINCRVQLKSLLIKATMLTKELDTKKLKCEELNEKIENLQNYNSSLKILKAQFGENLDPMLLPNRSNLLEDIQKEFNKN